MAACGVSGLGMFGWIRKLLTDRRGATAIEYGLILALVVLALMASLISMARTTVDIWDNVSDKVSKA